MKIYFPKYRSSAFLATIGHPRWIIVFVIICLLAGVCGLYLFWGGLLALAVLGIVGTLFAAAAYALLNWNKIDNTSAAPIKRSMPRITSGWDYRPTAIRGCTSVDRVEMETAEVLGSSARNENDYVWFNALECSANTLVDPSPDVPRAQHECAPAEILTSFTQRTASTMRQFRGTTKVL